MSIVQGWGVGEVCSFLKEKEVDEETVALFREAQVDGNQLVNLHDDDDSLKALGIKRAIPRKRIKTLIAELRAVNTPLYVVPVSVLRHDPSLPLDYGQCDIHKKPRGSTYCDSCKTSLLLLCDECIDTTHKGHKLRSVKDIRESLKEKASTLEEISKGVCEKIISECFQALDKLKENHVSCVKEVESVFDALQRALATRQVARRRLKSKQI